MTIVFKGSSYVEEDIVDWQKTANDGQRKPNQGTNPLIFQLPKTLLWIISVHICPARCQREVARA